MKRDEIHCLATLENLTRVTAFVEGCADRFNLTTKKKFGALVAIEEAFVNICSHAYPAGEGMVAITCETDGASFVLEIADAGRPFDVLSLPEPDTTSALLDRQIGGLGVHFIRNLSDEVSYRREKGQNILRMVFKRRQESSLRQES